MFFVFQKKKVKHCSTSWKIIDMKIFEAYCALGVSWFMKVIKWSGVCVSIVI